MKKGEDNDWVKYVKEYAEKNNMSYACALHYARKDYEPKPEPPRLKPKRKSPINRKKDPRFMPTPAEQIAIVPQTFEERRSIKEMWKEFSTDFLRRAKEGAKTGFVEEELNVEDFIVRDDDDEDVRFSSTGKFLGSTPTEKIDQVWNVELVDLDSFVKELNEKYKELKRLEPWAKERLVEEYGKLKIKLYKAFGKEWDEEEDVKFQERLMKEERVKEKPPTPPPVRGTRIIPPSERPPEVSSKPEKRPKRKKLIDELVQQPGIYNLKETGKRWSFINEGILTPEEKMDIFRKIATDFGQDRLLKYKDKFSKGNQSLLDKAFT